MTLSSAHKVSDASDLSFLAWPWLSRSFFTGLLGNLGVSLRFVLLDRIEPLVKLLGLG